MRQSFFPGLTWEQAAIEAPWAVVVVDVDGGEMAFESWADYYAWRGQK